MVRKNGLRRTEDISKSGKSRLGVEDSVEYVRQIGVYLGPKQDHEEPESSAPVILPSVRTVFETSFATIAAFQPFIGQTFVGYKVITAVYSVKQAYEERGLVGAASAVGKEAMSAPLASTQGTIRAEPNRLPHRSQITRCCEILP